MSKVRDKLWLWCHEAGSHTRYFDHGLARLKKPSRMTPAEAAYYLDIPNVIMVRYHGQPVPPYDRYALSLSPLKRVVWSIVGDGGCGENLDVDAVRNLAWKFPNITGAMMDDFFGRTKDAQGNKIPAPYTPEQLAGFKKELNACGQRLDLWVVLYTHQMEFAVREHLAQCDVVTLWTWKAADLAKLETNFERVCQMAPNSRKMLGCYMYDYGDGKKEIPVELMEQQCEAGLKLLRARRIEGIIFLASCICDLGLEAVEFTRQWIRRVGEQEIGD